MAFFRKIKEIKGLRGDVLQYVAQGIPQMDDEIAASGSERKRPFMDGD